MSQFPLGFSSQLVFVAFCLVCALLVFTPVYFSGFWPSSYDYLPQSILSGVLGALCLLLALQPRLGDENSAQNSVVLSPLAWLLIALFGWQIVSSVMTVYLHDTLIELARVGNCIAWCFILRRVLGDNLPHEDKGDVLQSRLLYAVLAVVAGTLLVVWQPLWGFVQTRTPQLTLTFYNNNLYANFCAMALPVALSAIFLVRRKALRSPNAAGFTVWLTTLCALLIAAGLVVSASKGGFLSAFAGVVVFVICVLRARHGAVRATLRRYRAASFAAALLLVVVGGFVASKTVIPRLQAARGTENHSTMFRVYTWRGTVEMIKARPVTGFGAGSFPSAYTQYATTGYTRSAHQLWLQIAAENGVPALLLLVGVCIVAARKSWRLLRTMHWPLASGALACLTAFTAHGFTDAGWSITSIVMLLMLVFAAIDVLPLGQNRVGSAPEKYSRIPAQSNLAFGWLGLSMALAGASWIGQRAATAESLWLESDELARRGAAQMALQRAREAVDSDPLSARMQLNLGDALERSGENADAAYERATQLRPTYAPTWSQWAEYRAGKGESPEAQWKRAVELDANDTRIRLARAQWLMTRDEKRALADLQHIAKVAREPYGRYPATPEMVDLNYFRAYMILGEKAVEKNQAKLAADYAGRAAQVLMMARKYETQQREMAQAMAGTSIRFARPENLDELEAQLKSLRERI